MGSNSQTCVINNLMVYMNTDFFGEGEKKMIISANVASTLSQNVLPQQLTLWRYP